MALRTVVHDVFPVKSQDTRLLPPTVEYCATTGTLVAKTALDIFYTCLLYIDIAYIFTFTSL